MEKKHPMQMMEEYWEEEDKKYKEKQASTIFVECQTLKDVYSQIQKHFPYTKYPFYQFKLLQNEIVISVSTHYIIRMCEHNYDSDRHYALVFNQNNKYGERGSLQQIAAVLIVYLEDRAKKLINELKYFERVHTKLQNNSEYEKSLKYKRKQQTISIGQASLKGLGIYIVIMGSMLIFIKLVLYLLG